jgi:glutathione S-transferase
MAAQTSGSKPTLWQIEVSHYSEKARWALDYKRVPHVRRSPPPGVHMAIARYLTGGARRTLPILRWEGRTIADSSEIIAALEERVPDPPLYPSDPEQRRRALELEDFFDEELGPHVRLLAWHELINEPQLMAEVASRTAPEPLRRAKRLTGAYARAFTSLRFGAGSAEAAAHARKKIAAAMDRLDSELEASGGRYLVGDEFGVADLTAASLFYPLVGPEEGPLPRSHQLSPPAMARFRDGLSDRPGFLWVEEIFRRHRKPAPPVAASASL